MSENILCMKRTERESGGGGGGGVIREGGGRELCHKHAIAV